MQEHQIRELLERHLTASETFLVDLKLTKGKLTVYADEQGGISLERCMEINRFLKQELEPDGFTESHEIEVSSPGPRHPLRDPRQYIGRIGKRLRVVLDDGAEISGRLAHADGEGFELAELPGKKNHGAPSRRFAFGEIREAHVEFEF